MTAMTYTVFTGMAVWQPLADFELNQRSRAPERVLVQAMVATTDDRPPLKICPRCRVTMVMTCHHCDLIIARDAAGIPVFHGGLSPEGSPMRRSGRSPNEPSHMRRAIIRNGEQFNVSVTELLPGPNGTVATCQELPDLIVIGDDPDDALRRAVKAIERRAGRAK